MHTPWDIRLYKPVFSFENCVSVFLLAPAIPHTSKTGMSLLPTDGGAAKSHWVSPPQHASPISNTPIEPLSPNGPTRAATTTTTTNTGTSMAPDPSRRNSISGVLLVSGTRTRTTTTSTKNPSHTDAALYRNRGLFLILLAQLFWSLMALSTRLLETGSQKFHALQISFVRQTVTSAMTLVWVWHHNVPHAPLGPRDVRWLLVARGIGGFWGVFGLYYSLTYLNLADATVITFLAPTVTSWACSVIPSLREPFTVHEFFAGVVSFAGVVLIVRPGSSSSHPAVDEQQQQNFEDVFGPLSSRRRLLAAPVALLGVLGSSCAYTTIRLIGKRAHPLVSVNYYSGWCALISLGALLTIPSVGGIVWPGSARQWALLGVISLAGFAMQFLFTSGLRLEKAGRGTNMVYSQMVFSLLWEKVVWGTTPGAWSIVGSAFIVGSALWVGTRRSKRQGSEATGACGGRDEEVGLIEGGGAS